ncbi:MAG: glutathione S-transferase family protein [Steroidobacteraceae bacterium]
MRHDQCRDLCSGSVPTPKSPDIMTSEDQLLVYHIPFTRSERVVWLLEEIGVPYALHRLSYRGGDLRKAEFLGINPFGMVPTIAVGPAVIRETGAIFEYILRRFNNGLTVGPDSEGYLTYLTWLHSIEATVIQPLVSRIMHTEVLPEAERLPEVARRSLGVWLRYLRIIDQALANRAFACGEHFTAVDVLLGHALRLAQESALFPAEFAGSRSYFDRLTQRAAYQRMLGA